MIIRLHASLLATLQIPEALPDIEVATLADELERPWSRVWASLDDDAIRSLLITWFVADEVHVINMSTAVTHQRRGLARALFEVLLAEAQSANARIVVLEVRKGNAPAIALYESFGFQVSGVRRAYYRDGEDALDMVRVVRS
jgi:ribosomal-protein-alanine N-acetyltransferase